MGNAFPGAAPHGCHPCAGEDRWCVIAVETDEQWRRLCEAMGRPGLADDAALSTLEARQGNAAGLEAAISAWTRTQDAGDVMARLQALGVPCGVVQSGEDLFRDPQLRSRGFITAVDHPRLGSIPIAGMPIHLSGFSWGEPRWLADLGAGNEHVFCGLLGYDRDQLAAWQASGVVV